jgi:isopentenyl-diphosphate delta-isomerase
MESRKKDHIVLAEQAQVFEKELMKDFLYEPLLASNQLKELPEQTFLGKKLKLPLWVSSMTGGTRHARQINKNLAMACQEFGMGMGLGSCRSILDSTSRFNDFDVRQYLGDDLPLMANLGIAQVEQVLDKKASDKILKLVESLNADGLFVHINPLQELLQPEGDIYYKPPIETIIELCETIDVPVIVKEVGQGMGPKSLQVLLKSKVAGIEFGALGGTNFSLIELLRDDVLAMDYLKDWASIGHTAEEMIGFINQLEPKLVEGKEIIISGGMNPLKGYFLKNQLNYPAFIGMAYPFLKSAQGQYKNLQSSVQFMKKSLQMAQQFLHRP